jgi:Flp pilus assembly pilin Flp
MNTETKNIVKKNESGQTLVEFVLLLASISIISFSFIKLINSNIGDRWQKIFTVILDDPNQSVELR